MTRLLVALGLLLVGCTQAQPTASVSASPQLSPRGPTAAATAMPSPSPNLPHVDLSCRLPVYFSSTDAGVVTLHGGFLQFPQDALVTDPAWIIGQHDSSSDFATAAAPVLHGAGGAFYDRAQSRWVPVRPAQSLPDGSAYAYVRTIPYTNDAKAYVVTVATASVRMFDLPGSSTLWQVADYNSNGVYLMEMSGLGGPGQGVWLLNPTTGSVTLIRRVTQLWMVRDGFAWVARFDTRDKSSPPAYSELAPANSLVQINLATGAETIWFYQPGQYPWMIGLDSHLHPIVEFTDGVRIIDRPGSEGELINGHGFASEPLGEPQGDGDRVWFGGQSGIFLYRPTVGIQLVYPHQSDPQNPSYIAPAGFCQQGGTP